MRGLMIFGAVLAVLSLAFLFGIVLPQLEQLQSQSAILGPLSVLAGPEAQEELRMKFQVLNVMRTGSIIGALIGGILFLVGLVRSRSQSA